MTKHSVVRLLFLILFVQFSILAYTYQDSYYARTDIVTAAREVCELSKEDRRSTISLNQNIVKAFEDTNRRNPNKLSKKRKNSLTEIRNELVGLQFRSKLDCNVAFPTLGWFP